MADPIDELLKQLDQGNVARSSSSANALPSRPSSDLPVPANSPKPKPIDHLLAEIEGKSGVKFVPTSEKPPQPGHDSSSEAAKLTRSLGAVAPDGSPNPQSVDALLSQLDGTIKNPPPVQPPILPHPSQIHTQIHTGEVAPAQPRPTRSKQNSPQPEPQTAKPVAPANPQLEKQKRRQAIEQKAQEWLKNLDPHGGEAHFFETLAEKYSSRLEAAIDFLGLDQEQQEQTGLPQIDSFVLH